MPSGGNRAGAGRKAKPEKYARPIATAEKKIADKLPFLIDQMMTLAEGVTVEEGAGDDKRVYQKPPDRQAIEYLVNRIMGRPTERHETDITTGGQTIIGYTITPPGSGSGDTDDGRAD